MNNLFNQVGVVVICFKMVSLEEYGYWYRDFDDYNYIIFNRVK